MYKWMDLIIEVLKNNENQPMTPEEIWSKAIEMNLEKKLGSKSQNPPSTLNSTIYNDLRNNGEQCPLKQVSSRPIRYLLRESNLTSQEIEEVIANIEETEDAQEEQVKNNYVERDLHPLLVKYTYESPLFGCYTKTIYHEHSTRSESKKNEWLHPDLVGVSFPFEEYKFETQNLQSSMGINLITLFSFEMKRELNYSNLRNYFFQAVSNSSWANEGYLVCLDMPTETEFKEELDRLSNAFGIGVIQLNVNDIINSKIVCSARTHEIVDWDTVDRLTTVSPDFKNFISGVVEDITIKKVKSTYDRVFSDEELESYLKEKKII